MLISVKSNGFISGYLTYQDIVNGQYDKLNQLDQIIECPDFPDDQQEAWEHFQEHYRCYKFVPVPPLYWRQTYGKNYVIPSADIVSQFTYYSEHEEELVEETREEVRRRREVECFPIINRGDAWYATLTTEQREERQEWYQAWLDAPDTFVVPEKPDWLK